MTEKSINDQLYEHYTRFQEGITAAYSRTKNGESYLDGPHLLFCREEEYARSTYKILFLGQENNGWQGPTDDIDQQVGEYAGFEHARHYKYRHGPYWRAVHTFNDLLNEATADLLGFVASNVRKYCSESGGRISPEDDRFVAEHVNVLPGELAILRPDVVIFFSGPEYDGSIGLQLEGEKLSFEPVVAGIAARELARVTHPLLPKHAYRTYHPNHLRFSRKWNFLQLIIADIKGHSIDNAFSVYQVQMRELATELGLLLEEPEGMAGNTFEGHYFYPSGWRWSCIGFEFEANGAGNFFYGISRKDSATPVPPAIVEMVRGRLPASDGTTAHWLWWRWSEHQQWNEKTVAEILAGKMKDRIRVLIVDMLNRLDGMEL